MSEQEFSIKIASDTSREKIFVEIYYNNEEWAEISQESDELLVQFYPHPNDKCWEFQCDEAIEAIEKAKNRLLGN